MANKLISRTQVPVEPKDLYLEISASLDAAGTYVEHQVRAIYRVLDDTGAEIVRKDYPDIPLTAPQKTSLASFVASLVTKANSLEGT